MRLGAGAGVSDGALLGISDRLRVFPQRARLVVGAPRGPGLASLSEFGVTERHVYRARDGIDRDRIAVLQQADRSANRGLRADMTDAEPVRGARKSAVGD